MTAKKYSTHILAGWRNAQITAFMAANSKIASHYSERTKNSLVFYWLPIMMPPLHGVNASFPRLNKWAEALFSKKLFKNSHFCLDTEGMQEWEYGVQ